MTEIRDFPVHGYPLSLENSPVADVATVDGGKYFAQLSLTMPEVAMFIEQPCFTDETRRTYGYELRELFRGLGSAGLENAREALRSVDSRTLVPFIEAMHASMVKEGYSESGRKQRLSIARSFCRFLIRLGVRDGSNPFELFDLPEIDEKRQHRPTHSRDDMSRIIRVIEQVKNPVMRYRDLAMVGLMARSGLRRAEVVTLVMADTSDGMKSLLVHGKGRKTRRVGVDSRTHADTMRYLELDGRALDGSKTPLFRATRAGARARGAMSRAVLSRISLAYAEAAGVTSAGCHAFRRAFATAAHKAGVPIEKISLAMGHSSTETTRRYIENILIEAEAVTVDF